MLIDLSVETYQIDPREREWTETVVPRVRRRPSARDRVSLYLINARLSDRSCILLPFDYVQSFHQPGRA
jgi:hypothetical protein